MLGAPQPFALSDVRRRLKASECSLRGDNAAAPQGCAAPLVLPMSAGVWRAITRRPDHRNALGGMTARGQAVTPSALAAWHARRTQVPSPPARRFARPWGRS